jgi:PST family polysaccharide transporter
MLPRVSVVIAAYNCAGFIDRAIASALTQTGVQVELIIVDDASTDDTVAVLQGVAATDARVRVLLSDRNAGPSAARNRGFEAAAGDWIAVLDADDAFLPGRLEALVRTAVALHLDIVTDNFAFYSASDGTVSEPAFRVEPANQVLDRYAFLTGARPYNVEPDFGLLKPIFNRHFWQKKELRYPTGVRHGEDFELIFTALLAGARYGLCRSQCAYLYTTRDSGQSRTMINDRGLIRQSQNLLGGAAAKHDPRLRHLLARRIGALRRLELDRGLAAQAPGRRLQAARRAMCSPAGLAWLASKVARKFLPPGRPSGPAEDVKTPGEASLKKASGYGLAISFAAQLLRFVLQFITSIIMARLLLPEHFGLLAMAAPILGFVQLFADLGLTQATVQRPKINQTELSFMFWISAAVSIGMGLIVILAAPLGAAFYGEPSAALIIMALGAIMMVGGLGIQHGALLNRNLRFGSLAAIDIISFVVGALAGIVAAIQGAQYWAIVISQALTTLTAVSLSWVLAGWLPSGFAMVPTARSLLGFGGNVTAFNVCNYFARNLDNVLIGRFLGDVQLGYYDRAYKLLLLPLAQINSPIGKVATPILARSLGDTPKYRRIYHRLLSLIIILTYPGVIVACVAGPLLVETVLGSQWAAAGPVFQVLAVGALFAPISNSTGWTFTTQDRTDEMRNYGLLSSIAFSISFVVGLQWGVMGVAACYIITGCVQGPLLWWASTRKGPITTKMLFAIIGPYVVALLPTALAVTVVLGALQSGPVALISMLVSAYVVFLATAVLFPSARATLQDLTRQALSLLAGSRLNRIKGKVPHASA